MLPVHPGGAAPILALCGQDATAAFNGQAAHDPVKPKGPKYCVGKLATGGGSRRGRALQGTNKELCESMGQTCYDATHNASITGDWTCTCPPPSSQSQVAGVVPQCTFDECTATASNKTCTDAGQVCIDPNNTVAGDWTCNS
eukprot:gene7973-15950_t